MKECDAQVCVFKDHQTYVTRVMPLYASIACTKEVDVPRFADTAGASRSMAV